MPIRLFLLLVSIVALTHADPTSDLTASIDELVQVRNLRGIQLQVTKNGSSIYYHNKGIKNENNQSIDSATMFRIASCSKSFSAVAIMQLVQQSKLTLNTSISDILGFPVINPYYPNIPITVQMILSHQSSIAQTPNEYDRFLTDTYGATSGDKVPHLKEIFTPGGKYYNSSIFPAGRKPGEYFHYSNLGYVITGTIIEIVTQQRFDIYMQNNILSYINQGLVQNATFNPSTIHNYKNLAAIYIGKDGQWIPNTDNYNSTIPDKNLTTYKIGTNGAIFGPQGGLRASVIHLNNYMYIHANKGVTKSGRRLLSEQFMNEIQKPRYQYHGSSGGTKMDFRLYGFGIFTTSYSSADKLINHQVVRGHTGSAYGLISGYHFWQDYTFSYIINGALNGYSYDSTTIYERERSTIHNAVESFILKLQ